MKVAAHAPTRRAVSSERLSSTAQKIASAITKGVPGIVDKSQRASLQAPAVAETRGKVTITYTVASPAAAKSMVQGFGPMDDENLLTDNLNLPDGVDSIIAHARANTVAIEAKFTPPPAAHPKAIQTALGMMSNFIMASAKNVAVVTPKVTLAGNKMSFSYELHGEPGFEKLDAASVRALAQGLKMDRATLQTNHIALPAFVKTATARASGSNLVVDVSW